MNSINCNTSFQTSENNMTQHFGQRVRMVTNFSTKCTGVFVDNDLRMKENDLSVREYEKLQLEVVKISESLN